MLKIHVLLCFGMAILYFGSAKAVTPEESKAFEAFAKPVIEQCQKDFGMDKESFAQKNLDEIDECLIACVVEKFGITNDEKIDGDALKALVTKFVGNEEERNKINKIVEECTEDANKSGDGTCNTSTILFLCLLKNGKDLWGF
ncbi:uncharacterized protein LOC114249298 [Bombyx mandarina]|uniref:Uncharacterized protein LOC114249298 n=1 Tax=Bombyx mandarina TaxID=7092 RepID=A0A6J2KCG8_BOMMA|nr:uncharacterized protein LOC114249298 [Bombyx mandarina]